jgi:dipeptidyl aminopeptidase/acylaminoacyl peptidase
MAMKTISLRKMLTLPTLAVALLAPPALAQMQTARPTAHDIASMSSISDPQLSPDGSMVVYTLRTRSFDKDTIGENTDAGWSSERQLWIAPADGSGEPRQITFAHTASSSPRFSPDGQWLAYLRPHDGKNSIHLFRITSGAFEGAEPTILDTGKLNPHSINFSPDGKQISFLASAPMTDAEQSAKDASGGAVLYGEEWRNDRLYAISIADSEVRSITDGFECVNNYAWSPAGDQIAIVVSQSGDPYYVFSLNVPKVIDANTGATLATLEKKPGAIGHLAWSPDNHMVAYEKGDGTLSLLNALMVHDVKRGKSWNAARSLDPTLQGFVWDMDGSIVVHLYDKTKSRFVKLSPNGKRAEPLPAPGRVFGASFSFDERHRTLVGISSTPSSPPNPTVMDLRTGTVTIVAEAHPYAADWTMAQGEVVRWTGPEGTALEGVLWRTPQAKRGQTPPLMVLPHGGPDSVTTESFSSWAQYFAARGYNVFRPNYRGGLGYGFDFYASNRGRFGDIEFMDIESGVDHLIEIGEAEADRLVYGGWSWGGFCTAWTVGHTGRYQAAVAGAPVTDTTNQYALSDINHGVAAQWEYKGDPWRQTERFDSASPIRHITNAITPTLIIQGMSDNRVPFGQGITLHRALADVGCETKFLAYPREPHGFREPAHVEHMLTAWADWYTSHLSSGR